MKVLKAKLFSNFFEFSLYILTSVLTLFIYSNVVEKIFVVDLPIVTTLKTQNFLQGFIKQDEFVALNSVGEYDRYGFVGKPILLKFPRKNMSLPMLESRQVEGGFLSIYDSLSYIVSKQTTSGRPKEILIFGSSTDRLLNFVFALSLGDRLVVQTIDNWLIHYKVTRTQLTNEPAVFSDLSNEHKLIFIKEVDTDNFLIIEADFLSIEEIQ